ncbi:neutral zinc metallopeptidase [Carnobacteriaceae bacterium zg-ZUI252]|nr:neutral zinc metallopeptidase [Carnobacteriaceae bacterium zg-ZUI252]MBS4770584.1 neutral zinc metallopeptidase [Carnobacteriaceae bacterium zg-ZUI240]
MKTDHLEESRNVEDRRLQTSSTQSRHYGNRMNSNASNAIFSLIFSRLGWKGKLIMMLGLLLFGGGISSLGGLLNTSELTPYQSRYIENAPSQVSDADAKFMSKVLATTEDHWTKEFRKISRTYTPPKLVFYTGSIHTGCGVGHASGGPFYCGVDQKVYIDVSFYNELSTRYKAKGDFAMAYVIAHEVGHHVQKELGILDDYHNQRNRLSEKQANALTVKLELQADYFAGSWAKYVSGQGLLEYGDIDEAMQAAHAVGDDTLQKEAYQKVNPDSFTHGTSEQRKRWFSFGYQYGDFEHSNTFKYHNNDL